MRNPVSVLAALLSVEFVLHTMSLCLAPRLVQTPPGAGEGLYALYSTVNTSAAASDFQPD